MSHFLPDDFDPSQGITLIAGQKDYPRLLAERIRAQNIPLYLIAFHDETDPQLIDSFSPQQRSILHVGQLGSMLKALQKFGPSRAIMAGQITPKKLFKGLRPDLKALRVLNSLQERNAETIFGALAQAMSQVGVSLLDGRSFLDDCLASPGSMTPGKINIDLHHLQHGIRVAKDMARLDVGQGIVFQRGTILAVEAFEGTDAMIRRCQEFKTTAACFIKTTKPQQDFRFDVPVFGLTTLQSMIEAGIPYAALETNKTIILQKEEVLQTAHTHNIVLAGYHSTLV